MKKIKLLTCLTLTLALIFGSSMTAFASEITDEETAVRDEDNIFYEGLPEQDEDGNYHYIFTYFNNAKTTEQTYRYYAEITSSHPMVCIHDGVPVENRYGTYYEYYLGHYIMTYSDGITKDLRMATTGTVNGVTYTVNRVGYELATDTEGNITNNNTNLNQSTSKFSLNISDGFTYGVSTNIPIVTNVTDAETYLATLNDDLVTNKKPLTDDDMVFNSNIPTPELIFAKDGGLSFEFNNASEDFYIELRGRWWSVDDIELFKQNLMWKYKYESLIKNDLSVWIGAGSHVNSVGEHDLWNYGEESFNDLLLKYPVDDRTYTGGSNALGNYFSGYSDALTTLKMLLNAYASSYNSCEVYVRYYTVDDSGNYNYGKWCHWLGNLAKESGSSGSVLDDDNIYKGQQSESGLTDEELEILESSGNSRNDVDLKEEIYGEYESPITGDSSDDVIGYFQKAIDAIKNIGNMLGEFPSLVARVFTFLPDWVIACIGVGIVLVIILRIVGR